MGTESIEHRRIDKADSAAIDKAIADGFDFIGTIHHYEKPLRPRSVNIFSASEHHKNACIDIALSVMKHSRFFSISKGLAHKVYRERIETLFKKRRKQCASEEFNSTHIFVAIPESHPNPVVGFAILDGNDIPLIAVSKQFQGRGVGRQLLERCEEIARCMEYDAITIATQGKNTQARRVYERCGFTLSSIDKEFHK